MQCQFCLENYETNETLELYCNHIFHKQCILKWFETCNSFGGCPICRQESISDLGDHIFIDKDIFESNKKNQINKNKELQELKDISGNLQTETLHLQDIINRLEDDCLYYKHKLEDDCLYYKNTIVKLGHELNTLDYSLLEHQKREKNFKKEILKLKYENFKLKLRENTNNIKVKNIYTYTSHNKWYYLVNRILYNIEK